MEDKMKLNFLAGVQVGDDIYFSAWNMNGLFKYNPELNQCDFLKIFPQEENWGLHSEAILYKNTIWFIPRASERIAIVDLDTLDITYLDLPECGHRPEEHVPPIRMRGCYLSGENFLFLIPFAYKLFITIDMKKKEIVYVEDWGKDEYAYSIGIRINDKLIICMESCNQIRIIDIASDRQIIKNLRFKNQLYRGIQSIGDWILLFPRRLDNGILLINNKTGELNISKVEDNKQWYYEYQVLTKENDILLVPYIGNKYVRIGIEDGDCYTKEFKALEVQDNVYCSTKLIYKNEIWYLSHVLENPVICYKKEIDEFRYYNVEIEQKKYNEDIVESIAKYGIMYSPLLGMKMVHEQIFSLNTFLQYIKKENASENITMESRIGKCIYGSIR